MITGKRVTILPTRDLLEWKLRKLVGKEGTVVSDVVPGNVKGCWVKLDRPYRDEEEWFVPVNSLQI